MEVAENLLYGLQVAIEPRMLLYCFIGVFLGTLIGVLPGIGALTAISLLLPATFHLPTIPAIVMLAGVFYGAQYGGSTASILLNLPGSPSSAVACLDGYPMAKAGRAGPALFLTTVASFAGAIVGVMLLIAFTPAISRLGLLFGSAEYFSIMLLGLVAVATLASAALMKAIAMILLGILLSFVGIDVNSGVPRFTFGVTELLDGLSLVALAMGLFGLSEVIGAVLRPHQRAVTGRISLREMLPDSDELRRSAVPIARGTTLGAFLGALPGTGPGIASFMAYAVEKKVAKQPERFGKGAVEGLTAPEAANNAAAQTAFVPMLSLGIPGDAVTALLLGALIIHGIEPGPFLINREPELFWGLIASFIIGNLMLLVLNIPMISLWVTILRIPYKLLYPAILMFVTMGVYSINSNVFDIYVVAALGVLGYLLVALRFELIPLVIGFVLGPLLEEHLRRALLLARGDPMVFLDRPISAAFLAVSMILLLLPLVRILLRRSVA